jgi:putative ABC transport system permease protein
VLSAGFAVAAAFAEFGANAAAPVVRIHGRVPVAPAGWLGRPALRVSEVWYRSYTRTTVVAGPGPRNIALLLLLLLVAAAAVGYGARTALSPRRQDLATLRALGWRRRQVQRHLLAGFALSALAAGLLAVVAAYAAELVLGGRPMSGWPLLSMPTAAAVTLAAAWWPVRRATAGAEPPSAMAARGDAPQRRPPSLAGQAVRNLLRTPARTVLGALVIAMACVALGLELAVRWANCGMAVGPWPSQPLSWQASTVNTGAVLVIVAMATVTVADLGWLTAGERAVELRTLRAIGWSARGVTRLMAWEAVLLGLAGGVVASALDVVGSLAVAHRTPARLLVLVATAAGIGATISLVAASLSAADGRRRSSQRRGPLARLGTRRDR